MSTWKTVYTLEWKILKHDRAALGVLLLFAVFLSAAAWVGGNHANQLSGSLERSQQDEKKRFDSLGTELEALTNSNKQRSAQDPRNTVWMGQEGAARLAVLPPMPLALIAVGQRDLHPQAVQVTSAVNLIRERETETPMAGPTRLQTGAFDPGFLFVVLFPLVIIALSYELLSAERERGTLAMLLSQPVSQGSLVLGKALARLSALCGLTLFFAGIGLLVGGADFSAAGVGLHLLLYACLLVAWATFWFALAVFVNSGGWGSARNALVLVGAWLVLVIVLPGLINVGINSFYPPPSRIELVHEAREAARDIERELNTLEGRHDVDPNVGAAAIKVVKVQEELAKRSEPVLRELSAQLRTRQSLLDSLRFLSPAILVQISLEDIAGSGSVRQDRFQSQADSFHQSYRSFFASRIQNGTSMTMAELAQVPRFQYQEEPAWELAKRVLLSILALFVLSGLFVLAAWKGMRQVGRLAA